MHHGPVNKVGIRRSRTNTCFTLTGKRGVGFVCSPASPARRLPLKGSAGRNLERSQRVCGIMIPPQTLLPRGLQIFSVYAPVQQPNRASAEERQWFCETFGCWVTSIDMGIPTIFVGDWNGSAEPETDYEGRGQPCCPLLARLLGLGGPLVDLAHFFPSLNVWTFRNNHGSSRIDAALVSHSALPLVVGGQVLEDVSDGGHAAIQITMNIRPLRLGTRYPRTKLPEVFYLPVRQLRESEEMKKMLEMWGASDSVRRLAGLPGDQLGGAILDALEALIVLAGGRTSRPAGCRVAYDSNVTRKLRRTIKLLLHASYEVRNWPSGPCPIPWILERALADLADLGIRIARNRATMEEELRQALKTTRRLLKNELAGMRKERAERWRDNLPKIWSESPGRVYSWIQTPRATFGQHPMLKEDGRICESLEEMDEMVKEFWVKEVWQREDPTKVNQSWEELSNSKFGPHLLSRGFVLPKPTWDGNLVRTLLSRMKKTAAPGFLGLPVSVWLVLPAGWFEAVARLLAWIQDEGGRLARVEPESIRRVNPEGPGNGCQESTPDFRSGAAVQTLCKRGC